MSTYITIENRNVLQNILQHTPADEIIVKIKAYHPALYTAICHNDNGHSLATLAITKRNSSLISYMWRPVTYEEFLNMIPMQQKKLLKHKEYLPFAHKYLLTSITYNQTAINALIKHNYAIHDCITHALTYNEIGHLITSITEHLNQSDDTIWDIYYPHIKQLLDYLNERGMDYLRIQILEKLAHKNGLRQQYYDYESLAVRTTIASHGYYLCYYKHSKSPTLRKIVAGYQPFANQLIFDENLDVVLCAINEQNASIVLDNIENGTITPMALPKVVTLLSDEDKIRVIKQNTTIQIKQKIIRSATKIETLRMLFPLVSNEPYPVRFALASRGIYVDDIVNEHIDIVENLICSGYTPDVLMTHSNYKIRRLMAKHHKHPYRLVKDKSIRVRKELALRGYALQVLVHDKASSVREAVAIHPCYYHQLIDDTNESVRGSAIITSVEVITIPSNYYYKKDEIQTTITYKTRKQTPMIYFAKRGGNK